MMPQPDSIFRLVSSDKARCAISTLAELTSSKVIGHLEGLAGELAVVGLAGRGEAILRMLAPPFATFSLLTKIVPVPPLPGPPPS